MRIYYEAREIVEEAKDFDADWVRLDVTDMVEKDLTETAADITELMGSAKIQVHYCFHDEGKSCKVEDL